MKNYLELTATCKAKQINPGKRNNKPPIQPQPSKPMIPILLPDTSKFNVGGWNVASSTKNSAKPEISSPKLGGFRSPESRQPFHPFINEVGTPKAQKNSLHSGRNGEYGISNQPKVQITSGLQTGAKRATSKALLGNHEHSRGNISATIKSQQRVPRKTESVVLNMDQTQILNNVSKGEPMLTDDHEGLTKSNSRSIVSSIVQYLLPSPSKLARPDIMSVFESKNNRSDVYHESYFINKTSTMIHEVEKKKQTRQEKSIDTPLSNVVQRGGKDEKSVITVGDQTNKLVATDKNLPKSITLKPATQFSSNKGTKAPADGNKTSAPRQIIINMLDQINSSQASQVLKPFRNKSLPRCENNASLRGRSLSKDKLGGGGHLLAREHSLQASLTKNPIKNNRHLTQNRNISQKLGIRPFGDTRTKHAVSIAEKSMEEFGSSRLEKEDPETYKKLEGLRADATNGDQEILPSSVSMSDFECGKLIGRGAFAIVREAVYKPKNIKVAIKIYDRFNMKHTMRTKNVKEEIKIMRHLHHPNIIRFFDYFSTKTFASLVLEFIPGSCLASYLKESPNHKLSELNTRIIFKQIVSAVAYCHSKGIAHRDIKLENILVQPEKKLLIKLIDFGLSTVCSPTAEVKSKVFCGTPSYMAPEILKKKDYLGTKADIWALGILLYVLLTGTFPFKGASDRELFQRICKGEVLYYGTIPENVQSLIKRILTVDPESRPTAQEVLSYYFPR